MLDKQFQQINEKDKLVTIEVATILEEILKQIKNDKSEFEKTYEQRIVIKWEKWKILRRALNKRF